MFDVKWLLKKQFLLLKGLQHQRTTFFIEGPGKFVIQPRAYETFFMLSATENEISTAHKNQITEK